MLHVNIEFQATSVDEIIEIKLIGGEAPHYIGTTVE